MLIAIIVIVQHTDKMTLIVNVKDSELKAVVLSKFDFLLKLFNFDPNCIAPNKIEVNILDSIDKFLEVYKREYNHTPPEYVVGFAASNGRVFVLHKELFEKRGHPNTEFENVLVHELCHILIRRILDPKHTFRWIEEGLCQYIAFKGTEFKVKKFVSFRELESREDWEKNQAYQQSAKFFEFLDKEFGMNKIISFIKKIKLMEEYKAFKEVFGEFELIQEEFIKFLKVANGN